MHEHTSDCLLPTDTIVTMEGVFLPHAAWNEHMRNVTSLSQMNAELLRTVVDLLARLTSAPDPDSPPTDRRDPAADRYDLRTLREMF